jgi:hypothetical protein
MKTGTLLGVASTALVWLTGYSGLVFCIGLLVAGIRSGTPLELWEIGLLLVSSSLLGLASALVAIVAIVAAYRVRQQRAAADSAA